MKEEVFNGVVNGKEVPIIKVVSSVGPGEFKVLPYQEMSEGISDIMVVGLQYYEFSTFSILIEVIDEEGDSHHFLFDSVTFQDKVEEAFQPLKVEHAYKFFNEHVRKELDKEWAFKEETVRK